jgi:hypothetical protein
MAPDHGRVTGALGAGKAGVDDLEQVGHRSSQAVCTTSLPRTSGGRDHSLASPASPGDAALDGELLAHCGSAPLARPAFSASCRAAVQGVNGSARCLAGRSCVWIRPCRAASDGCRAPPCQPAWSVSGSPFTSWDRVGRWR